ncbi:MAG: aconitase/3-isopropylmalate dehydratase large subunit family protein [Pseudomonadota bacterium]
MGATIIEKILAAHAGVASVKPGDIIDMEVDSRVARDFGGANVVKNLLDAGLGVNDPARTCFTFYCNPGGSDQKYAANQQTCRMFAAAHGVKVYDIDAGIGTHIAIEQGLAWPGSTFVSTDSHANIMGAIGAFGQGMGDADIAGAWAHGSAWFSVPPTIKVVFEGQPGPAFLPKDLVLAAAQALGATGLLGCAAELYGPTIDALDLAGRITVASMATEMGGIIALIPPSAEVVAYCRERTRQPFEPLYADEDASYLRTVVVDLSGKTAMVARPGHPDDVVAVESLPVTRVDSVFIGSCTNGRFEDLAEAARVLRGRTVHPSVVLKVVPATDAIWRRCLDEGLWEVFKQAGALIGNAGCGGCAAGQIGQNGPGEITVSTGNRNFPGKQGRGAVYLASPATAAASAVAGIIRSERQLDEEPIPERPALGKPTAAAPPAEEVANRPETFAGRAWVIDVDSIDTDMIYHNRYLAETDPTRMGQYAFDNLKGWEDFAKRAEPGDIIVTGANFGAGSSRQQAVTCFKTLQIPAIVARSFGAIYERNAINEALPVIRCGWAPEDIEDGDEIEVDLASGRITNITRGAELAAEPFTGIRLEIYRRGGLLRS